MATIRIRRGTTAYWEFGDPVLRPGEPGVDVNLHKWKVGDGVTPWSELAWAGGGYPVGGTAGQVLAKVSDADQDVHWVDAPEGTGVPPGAVDYDDLPPGTMISAAYHSVTGWPARPTDRADIRVNWVGGDADTPPTDAVEGWDLWDYFADGTVIDPPDDGGDGGDGGSGSGSGIEPTMDSVGPASGTTFTTITGDYTLTDGEHLVNKHITGSVYHNGTGASMTDCQIDGGVFPNTTIPGVPNSKVGLTLTRCAMDVIYNTAGLRDLTVDTCLIGGDDFDETLMQIADGASGVTTNLVIRDSYFYGRPDLTRHGGGDPHWEAIHLGGTYGFDITNTVFDFEPLSGPGDTTTRGHITACVTLESSFSGSGRVGCSGNFSGNYLYGGGFYELYCNLVGGSTVNDNAFHDGGVTVTIGGAADFTATGNTLDGAPYSF